MRELLQIGEVAKLIGVSPKTIRYYHKIGLLAGPKRTDGGYRLYTAQDLSRLQRIRRLRSLGLHLDRIAEIPRSTIIAARQVRERVAFPVASFDAEKRRIFAAFSDRGQVLLVLVNVDQRDEFLADLNLQAISSGRDDVTRLGDEGDASVPTHHFTSPAPTRVGGQAIRTENLTRHYKGFIAVDNLNLAVHRGEIYGFLGSNGAGKTTTMKMLVGLLQPDGRCTWIGGHDVWKEPMG